MNPSPVTALDKLRAQSPLIHHLTNVVTVNDCANITLALGGSPAMAEFKSDALDLVVFAGALVINMGTLFPQSVASMVAAGKKARTRGTPVVFDPVAAGATSFRRSTATKIVNAVKPSIIKGNAAEIRFLAGEKSNQRGVDSLDNDADQAAVTLARKTGAVVVATGVVDSVTDGKTLLKITGGTALLGRITGTGCMSASLIGCYAAVEPNFLHAAALGILTMNIAGEIAEKNLKENEGTGHFRVRLLDAVSLMKTTDLPWEGRVSRVEL